MDLSLTSDYVSFKGCPEPYLAGIAEAGFTHVHWCHHWCTDFLYSDSEISQIGKWLGRFGLKLTAIHASAGDEKGWSSDREYERLAGVELVANRIEMAARLCADVIIMHIPAKSGDADQDDARQLQVRKSLDALEPLAAERKVRIAIENHADDDYGQIRRVLAQYPPQYIGHCYDSGHGNIGQKGLEHLDTVKDRLIAVHFHDNDGRDDLHLVPMTGTVDWSELARIIAESAYTKCVSLECTLRNQKMPEDLFRQRAFDAGTAISKMIDHARKGAG